MYKGMIKHVYAKYKWNETFDRLFVSGLACNN